MPGQVDLGYTRKVTERVLGSKAFLHGCGFIWRLQVPALVSLNGGQQGGSVFYH